jgi:formamidopyrimidine-DNA glycosylase
VTFVLCGSKICSKFTYITLSNTSKSNPKSFYLFNTLGLTGGWTIKGEKKTDFAKCENCHYLKKETDTSNSIFTYPNMMEYITEDAQNEWFHRALNHLNVEFITDKKTKENSYISFYFYDQLSFGTLKYTSDKLILEKKLKELGADLMDSNTTFEIFRKQITKKVNEKKSIGNVIVNQKLISGVGNYLRADALWMAKISPFRKVEDILDNELELLFNSVRTLMWGDYNYDEGVKKGIITKGFKIPRDYGQEFFVYRQDTDINGNKVSKKELFEGSQKRFIFWVEDVQK